MDETLDQCFPKWWSADRRRSASPQSPVREGRQETAKNETKNNRYYCNGKCNIVSYNARYKKTPQIVINWLEGCRLVTANQTHADPAESSRFTRPDRRLVCFCTITSVEWAACTTAAHNS